MREHRKGDRIKIILAFSHAQLGEVKGTMAGKIIAVSPDGEIEIEIWTSYAFDGRKTIKVLPGSDIQNLTIADEEYDCLADQRRSEQFEEARLIPPNEVEFVLYDDEYMSAEALLEQLEGVVRDGLDESWIPDFVYVADKDPLTMIDVQGAIEERIGEWNSHFDNWSYPPEWNGLYELDAAIKAFEIALEVFEKANEDYWAFTCDHKKKVNVHALIQYCQDKTPH